MSATYNEAINEAKHVENLSTELRKAVEDFATNPCLANDRRVTSRINHLIDSLARIVSIQLREVSKYQRATESGKCGCVRPNFNNGTICINCGGGW